MSDSVWRAWIAPRAVVVAVVLVYLGLPADGRHAYLDEGPQITAPISPSPDERQLEDSGIAAARAVTGQESPAPHIAFPPLG